MNKAPATEEPTIARAEKGLAKELIRSKRILRIIDSLTEIAKEKGLSIRSLNSEEKRYILSSLTRPIKVKDPVYLGADKDGIIHPIVIDDESIQIISNGRWCKKGLGHLDSILKLLNEKNRNDPEYDDASGLPMLGNTRKKDIFLKVTGGMGEMIITLSKEKHEISIGSTSECDIKLGQNKEEHARIIQNSNTISIVDLPSSYPVYVNNVRIPSNVEFNLDHEYVLSIGKVSMEISSMGDEPLGPMKNGFSSFWVLFVPEKNEGDIAYTLNPIPCNREVLSIGGDGCDWAINNVHGEKANIFFNGYKQLILIPLEKNIKINGNRVEYPLKLKNGDIISLGEENVTILFGNKQKFKRPPECAEDSYLWISKQCSGIMDMALKYELFHRLKNIDAAMEHLPSEVRGRAFAQWSESIVNGIAENQGKPLEIKRKTMERIRNRVPHDELITSFIRIPAFREEIIQLGENAVDPLIDLLNNREWETIQEITHAIIEIGRPAVPSLVRLLDNNRWFSRVAAVNILGEINDERAIWPLVNLFNDNKPDIYPFAAEALEKMCEKSVPALLKALEKGDINTKSNAIMVLKRIGDRRAIEPLKGMLDSEYVIASKVAGALIEMAKSDNGILKKEEKALCYMLQGDSLSAKRMGDSVHGFVMRNIRHKHETVRYTSAEVLSDGGGKAVCHLISALKDSKITVVNASIHSLIKNKDMKAIQPLIKTLKRTDHAKKALYEYHRYFDGKKRKPVLSALEKASYLNSDPIIRAKSLELLERVVGSKSVPFMVSAVREDRSPQVKNTALGIIERYGIENCNIFVEALGDGETIRTASMSLVKMNKNGLDITIKALKHENPKVRAGAAYALGKFDDKKAVDALIKSLQDKDSSVRAESARSIERLIGRFPNKRVKSEAIPGLISVLRHENKEVRMSAKSIIQDILDKCSTVEETEEYLENIEEGMNNFNNPLIILRDFLSKREADATARSMEIIRDFLEAANEKKEKFYKYRSGPYR